MASVSDIRSTFLDFFARNGHTTVPSSPLVPRNDPTLMFTNAGMVQFKNVFTGLESRTYSRAATSQKCVRAGGKHNDLDNVGYTARHHTFFEMLGNFSFGDYFKADAIEFAWSLITRDYALPREKLSVTVYHEDEEAFQLWKKIAGLPESRIIRIATSDNFWSMGDTGPCGPCSEIFFDHGPHVQGGPPGSPDADGDRFIEVWNLVFMQYEQLEGGDRISLPRPSIDTGMGLERISAVLQGTHDNYRTDLMQSIIRAVADLTSVSSEGNQGVSHRVIADHLRAASFLVADGVLPSNEGRGYVLRRIMRRGMRHAHLLGARDPLMHRLVPVLVREMGTAYPELVRAEALITETLELEESRFRRTLERGLHLLDGAVSGIRPGGTLAGDVAFKLYDTFGFPLDLTQDALRSREISVELDGFQAAMARQKAEARAAWSGSGDVANEAIWFHLREKHGGTEFLGYETERAEAVVLGIVQNGQEVSAPVEGDCSVIVNQTPFYAESGGQVGDQGVILGDDFSIEIHDTIKRAGDLYIHVGRVTKGLAQIGRSVKMDVAGGRRRAIRANHSATHLLHEALRSVLGDHIAQKGSLVGPDRLRFDVSHPKPMLESELSIVEAKANAIVLRNEPVITRLMGVEDAMKSGARALFGEKYGDEVRVVAMGTESQSDGTMRPYSVELCGGTHVQRTGDIGMIAIVEEAAVAAGVRRIEALTGERARAHFQSHSTALKAIAATLKVGVDGIVERVASVAEDRRRLDRELADARRKLAMGGGNSQADEPKMAGSIPYLAKAVAGVEVKDLKGLADQHKARIGSGVVALGVVGEDGRAGLVVAVTADLQGKADAVELVRIGSKALDGAGGGGRWDMAQAGGPNGANMELALGAIAARLAEIGN